MTTSGDLFQVNAWCHVLARVYLHARPSLMSNAECKKW